MKVGFCPECNFVYFEAWRQCPHCDIYSKFSSHEVGVCFSCGELNEVFNEECDRVHTLNKEAIDNIEETFALEEAEAFDQESSELRNYARKKAFKAVLALNNNLITN